MFTTLDWLVVLSYLAATAGVGLWQAARVKTAGDYFAGGRTFSKWLMMMHSLGTGTHADDPVGVTGAAYQRGFSGIWYTYVYLFATPFYWLIAPVFRRSRYLTTADFFEERLGRGMGLLYSVMGVLIFSINTGTLLKGTEQITTAMTQGAVKGWVSILLMTVVFVAYGTAGGLMATVVVESIQGLLIVVMSLLLVPFGLRAVGGFAGLRAALPDSHFSLHAPAELTLGWIATMSVAMLIGIVAQPHIMEVCASGKTEWEGRVGFTYGNMVKRFCAIGWALVGVVVAALVAQQAVGSLGTHRELAFGVAIRHLLPPGLVGLMFAAILAAQMSTLSAFMVAGSALLARNLYQKYFLADTGEAHEWVQLRVLRFGRYAGLGVVVLGVVFAFIVPSVTDALAWFWSLNAMLGVFMWAAVLWRPTNSVGCWVSFVLMAGIWLVLGPLGQLLVPGSAVWGLYAGKASVHLLLLSYVPAGVGALVMGSLISQRHLRGREVLPGLALLAVCGVLYHYCGLPGALMLAGMALGKVAGWIWPAEPDEAALDRFYTRLRTPVGREAELVAAGIDVVYAGESTGHPWELNHPRLVTWGGFAAGLLFACGMLALLAWVAGLGR